MTYALLLCLALGFMQLVPCHAQTDIAFGKDTPVVDGTLDDACWQGLPWHSDFTLIGTKTPAPVQTRFRIFHDNRNLYLAVEALEPAMDKLVTKSYSPGSSMIWMNDSLELSFTPDDKALVFYKFLVDSRGSVCDMLARDDNTNTEKYLCFDEWEGLPTIRTSRQQDRWCLEAAIPLGAFALNAEEDETWRINVARNRYAGTKPAQLSSWSQMPYRSHMIPKAFRLVNLKQFNPERFLLDIDDLACQIKRNGQAYQCQLETTIHNNTGSFVRFRRVAMLRELEQQKPYQAEADTGLQAEEYRRFDQTIPCQPKGKYRLTLALYSHNTNPVLLRCVSQDVELAYCPLDIKLVRPPYRDNLYATMPDKTIEARILSPELKGRALEVELTGKGCRETRRIDRASGQDTVSFDGAQLADGSYMLTVRGTLGTETLTVQKRIRKLPYQKGEVWFDAAGVTHVDGKPFFPFGWYGTHGRVTHPWLNSFLNTAKFASVKSAREGTRKRLENSGMRTMMFPFQDLDPRGWVPSVIFKDPETRTKGLTPPQKAKLIEFVTGMSSCEGLLGWYMADEPECRDNNPRWYEEAREIIADIDPYHPCIMLNWGIEGIKTYYRGADVLLPDCYPQYFEDGSTGHARWCSSDWAKTSTALRPAWQMPLMTSWPALARDGKTRGVPASYFDQRSQFFQALIHNVKGFNMYAWHDSQRFSSFIFGPDAIGETLMLMKDYWFVNSTPQGVSAKTTPDLPQFQAGIKELTDGRFCVIAVNTSLKPAEVELALKRPFTGVLHVAGEDRQVQVRNGRFTDRFTAAETHLYLTDGTLAQAVPKVADTVEAIRRHREGRRKPGNLVGIGEMLEIDYVRYAKGTIPDGWPRVKASSDRRYYSTMSIGSLLYLFDGLTMPNRVEYTWSPQVSDKKPWLEITLPKRQAIRKIVLYSPSGNLISGKITTDTGKTATIDANAKERIEVPLSDQCQTIRLEILQRKDDWRKDVEGRLLSEVEIY